MITNGLLARIGGIVALISLTVLPLASCGGSSISGVEMLTTEGLNIEIKVFLLISIICALVAIIVYSKSWIWIVGFVGLGSLISSYLIFREEWNVELETGGYLSVIGFIMILSDIFIVDNVSYSDDIFQPIEDELDYYE